jgi:hypothetical protein
MCLETAFVHSLLQEEAEASVFSSPLVGRADKRRQNPSLCTLGFQNLSFCRNNNFWSLAWEDGKEVECFLLIFLLYLVQYIILTKLSHSSGEQLENILVRFLFPVIMPLPLSNLCC